MIHFSSLKIKNQSNAWYAWYAGTLVRLLCDAPLYLYLNLDDASIGDNSTESVVE